MRLCVNSAGALDAAALARHHLLPEFGAGTPLARITTERIDRYRNRLLADGKLSRDWVRQSFVALNALLKARDACGGSPTPDERRRHDPDAEGIGNISVLTPVQVEGVARAVGGGVDAGGAWGPSGNLCS